VRLLMFLVATSRLHTVIYDGMTFPSSGWFHCYSCKHDYRKTGGNLERTWYVSVTILKGVEVVHEFIDRDLEGLKQTSVFKEPVGDLEDR